MATYEKIKFLRRTSDGAGKYYVEAHGWWNKNHASHGAPDMTGQGEGSTPKEAEQDAIRSMLGNEFDAMIRASRGEGNWEPGEKD